MNHFERLAARYLDELLSTAECRELAALLERDLDSAVRLAELRALHGQLGAIHCAPGPDAIESILAEIARAETEFVESVFLRVKAERQQAARKPWNVPGEMLALLWRRTAVRRGLALAASIVLCLSLAVWWFPRTNNEATLSLNPGAAATLERGTERFPARDLSRLQRGDALRSDGANAPIALSFTPEKTRVELYPGGELRLGSGPRGKRFELRAGKLTVTVARQRPLRPMVITTPQAAASVLGTRFTLVVDTNATRLEVAEGKVQFVRTSDRATVKVAAGNYAVASRNYELLAQPLTGSILREYWTNFPGIFYTTFLSWNPAFPDHPNGREYLSKFEAPDHWGRNYGARICGYLHPPRTGGYTFWIAAAAGGELWLSPDDNPDHRQQIGHAASTGPHEWKKGLGQESSLLTLVAGRKYYIEALHKQGSHGDDHLAVAWQGPGRECEVIPGEYLSPFKPKPMENKP